MPPRTLNGPRSHPRPQTRTRPRAWSRSLRARSRLLAAGALAASVALVASACSDGDATAEGDAPAQPWSFVTRPDLTPPVMETTTGTMPAESGADATEGNVLALGPKDLDRDPAMQGALLTDASGEPVWVKNTDAGVFDVRVQEYRGEPVLTYWEGTSTESGTGTGWVTVLDTHYQQVAKVTTGGDLGADHTDIHESTITDDDTMLLLSYVTSPADLSALGGPSDGYVLEGVVQEVDIATGAVVWEWRSLDHVPVTDSYEKLGDHGTKDDPYDYIHLNSVDPYGDGAFLVSSRHTHTLYKVDRATGDVDWHLGGKENDFAQGAGTATAWQHDARVQDDGTITVFDNESSPHVGSTSRGLRIAVDEKAMTTSLVAQYLPPVAQRYSDTQGNVQVLPDGNVLVGWGQRPYVTEYTADGTLLGELSFGSGTSYRAYRATWHATPTDPPDVVVERTGGDAAAGTVHVSWNGATDVARWQVVSGDDASSATVVATAATDGFETSIPTTGLGAYVAVRALDADGKVLGTGTATGTSPTS